MTLMTLITLMTLKRHLLWRCNLPFKAGSRLSPSPRRFGLSIISRIPIPPLRRFNFEFTDPLAPATIFLPTASPLFHLPSCRFPLPPPCLLLASRLGLEFLHAPHCALLTSHPAEHTLITPLRTSTSIPTHTRTPHSPRAWRPLFYISRILDERNE